MTALPLTINRSIEKQLSFLIGWALLFAFVIWAVTGSTENKLGHLGIFFAWLLIIFLGLSGTVLMLQLLFGSRTPLILTESGFTYPTFSPDEIPWRFVRGIFPVSIRGSSFLAVYLEPNFARNVRRNRFLRFANWRGRSFTLNAMSLDISHDQLTASMSDCWRAAQDTAGKVGTTPPPPQTPK